VGLFKRFWPRPVSLKFPTLRFRGKVVLGFTVVLAVSTITMGIAYLGFERVSMGVASYRTSVAEADLARNIDRELISYRGLARYYVATAKEDDAKAALAAEASLKDAINQSMKGTTNPARLNEITRLAREFTAFTKIFADILKVKRDSALVAQNQLARAGNTLRFKLDDLPSNADDAELQAIEFGAKKATTQFQTVTALANNFVVNSEQAVAASALARLKFVENSLQAISSADERIVQSLKEAAALLAEYQQALTKLVANAKEIDELVAEMADSAAAIGKAASAMKADLFSDQQRLELESDSIIGETERLILMLAAGGFLIGAVLALLLGKGISRPMMRCARRCANSPAAISTSSCRALDARTNSVRWRPRWRNSRCRRSPRPSATPPPRTPRTGRAARRGARSLFALPMISRRRWAPSSRTFRLPPDSWSPLQAR
jgi:hypothetical protein